MREQIITICFLIIITSTILTLVYNSSEKVHREKIINKELNRIEEIQNNKMEGVEIEVMKDGQVYLIKAKELLLPSNKEIKCYQRN
jgi:hypothetical protein